MIKKGLNYCLRICLILAVTFSYFVTPDIVEAATAEVEADDVDVNVDGCEAGTEIGTFTEVGAFTDIGLLAGAGAGAGAGTETGATPGSGIGIPVDPATEAGSNLVFICAVLLVIHNPLPIKLHWIWSLLFQFYILQNHI